MTPIQNADLRQWRVDPTLQEQNCPNCKMSTVLKFVTILGLKVNRCKGLKTALFFAAQKVFFLSFFLH